MAWMGSNWEALGGEGCCGQSAGGGAGQQREGGSHGCHDSSHRPEGAGVRGARAYQAVRQRGCCIAGNEATLLGQGTNGARRCAAGGSVRLACWALGTGLLGALGTGHWALGALGTGHASQRATPARKLAKRGSRSCRAQQPRRHAVAVGEQPRPRPCRGSLKGAALRCTALHPEPLTCRCCPRCSPLLPPLCRAALRCAAESLEVRRQNARAGVLRPAFVLVVDHVLRSVVLCVRGTREKKDLFTTLAGACSVVMCVLGSSRGG